ncbi:hypothetical protein cyc_01100 [Cyclospora cayetanensis]|uniref:Uncharacterized protein n=1 Tax=Cyclospora cayetanensis TaxID=88456 RepID=A0A1D3CS55_9EIME|nr:hypothetical protein cyc_01100 [Cyclospora cayetanensis]
MRAPEFLQLLQQQLQKKAQSEGIDTHRSSPTSCVWAETVYKVRILTAGGATKQLDVAAAAAAAGIHRLPSTEAAAAPAAAARQDRAALSPRSSPVLRAASKAAAPQTTAKMPVRSAVSEALASNAAALTSVSAAADELDAPKVSAAPAADAAADGEAASPREAESTKKEAAEYASSLPATAALPACRVDAAKQTPLAVSQAPNPASPLALEAVPPAAAVGRPGAAHPTAAAGKTLLSATAADAEKPANTTKPAVAAATAQYERTRDESALRSFSVLDALSPRLSVVRPEKNDFLVTRSGYNKPAVLNTMQTSTGTAHTESSADQSTNTEVGAPAVCVSAARAAAAAATAGARRSEAANQRSATTARVTATKVVAFGLCWIAAAPWIGGVVTGVSLALGALLVFLASLGIPHLMLSVARNRAMKAFTMFRPNAIVASSFGSVVLFHMSIPKLPLVHCTYLDVPFVFCLPSCHPLCGSARMVCHLSDFLLFLPRLSRLLYPVPLTLSAADSRGQRKQLEDSLQLIETVQAGRGRLEILETGGGSLKKIDDADLRSWIEEVFERGRDQVLQLSASGVKDMDTSLFLHTGGTPLAQPSSPRTTSVDALSQQLSAASDSQA